MKMKINRPVGATRQRNTASIRRTVLYTAVVAAIGLFLAGLPVAGTTPAQAQTSQDQSEWYINDAPRLYYKGTYVGRESLSDGWNSNVAWGRIKNGGAGRGNPRYTYATGGDINSYYTFAIWNSPVENQVEWRMGSRIGTQQISVHIPRNSRATTVTYQIHITGQPIQKVTVNQRYYRQENKNWANLLNPSTGEVRWPVNGAEVSVWVNDNEAQPHHNDARSDSRIGISAVGMKCLPDRENDCTTTTTPPTTTNPPPSSSSPRISGLANELTPIVDHFPLPGFLPDPVGGNAQDSFRVSPSSADVTATVAGSVSGVKAEIDKSGESARLIVTTNGRVDFDDIARYRIVVTARARDGSRAVTTRNVYVTVAKPKYRVERTGFLGRDKRLVAQRTFRTAHGTLVLSNSKGGIVKHQSNNLSHFGTSWIAEGAKVWGEGVRVSGNALVEDSADLHDNVKVFGNAKLSGNVKLSHNAEVSGNASVASWWHLTQVYDNAKIFGSASVHSRAKVYDNAEVSGNAQVYGNTAWTEVYRNARVYGTGKVTNGAKVSGNAWICGEVSGRGTQVSGNSGRDCPDDPPTAPTYRD